MQGRGGNRPGPFEGFPDPFANFGFGMGGGMGPPGSQGGGGGGGGGRRSLFDVFDNDPFFSDPFFTRPFGGSFGSLFGSHGGGFGNPFFGGVPQPPVEGAFLSNRPHNPHADEHRRGPIIEELPDDVEHPHQHARAQSNQEPIIEHPDDDVRPVTELPRQSRIVERQGPLTTPRNSNRTQSYSFQSSSVSYGGPNGVQYSSSASRRMGPNGVVEEEFQEKDLRTGKETKRHSRGVGEKGLSVTRKRTSEGREQTLDTLHNLNEDEIPDFERTWEEQEKMLPRWNKIGPLGIGSSQPAMSPTLRGSGSRTQAALPSPGGWPVNPPRARRV